MKTTEVMFWLTVCAVVCTMAGLFAGRVIGRNEIFAVRYDCSVLIGGWHPDVPLEVQKKCREMR